MASDAVSASTELDIFATKAVQTLTLEMTETAYKPIASLDQSDLEFLIPADHDTYIDLNIHLYIRGKLIKTDGAELENPDHTTVTNNFLHSIFSQCSITRNGITITPATDLYKYRAYLETLLTYVSDAADSHLTKAFWYLDKGDMLPCDPTAPNATNDGFIARWQRINHSKEVEKMGRLHSDICNVPDTLTSRRLDADKIEKGQTGIFLDE